MLTFTLACCLYYISMNNNTIEALPVAGTKHPHNRMFKHI